MLKTIIKQDKYTLKNYSILTNEEKEIALDFRNKNKEWMINNTEITLEKHLKWCESLRDNKKQIYYLVFTNQIPFMSIDYHDIDLDTKEAYWGYFLGNNDFKGEVLKIEKIIIDIAFGQLGLKKLICLNDINNHVIKIHKFFGFQEAEIVTINDRKFQKMYLEKDLN